jgi:hypothetical protein
VKDDERLEALRVRFPDLRWQAGAGTNVYHGHGALRWIAVERDISRAGRWYVSTREAQVTVRASTPVEAVELAGI